MDIITLKISIVGNDILININDIQHEKIKSSKRYFNVHLDEIFDTPKLSALWKKMCSVPSYIYFRYNVTNLNLRLKFCNLFNSGINNKTLLSNLFINKDDSTLTIDTLDTNRDVEINIVIKIILPTKRYSHLRTNNTWATIRDRYVEMFFFDITTQIKLTKPNPMFTLCRIDNINDYEKKIKSFTMPLYELKNNIFKRLNYNVVFDLYPSQSNYYILITSEIINNITMKSYKFHFDKDCTKCINRINNCELNMISKVQLCCYCNVDLIRRDLDTFLDNNKSDTRHKMCIQVIDFPSYIKDNFNTFPFITI
jgi:hypothetical protein